MFQRKKSEIEDYCKKEETIVKVELTRTKKFVYRIVLGRKQMN
jgi:hypothetical protein